MRFLLLFLLAFMISPQIKAQRNSIMFKTGYGSYRMKDMKELQDSFMEGAIIPYKTTAAFPSFLTFELQYIIELNEDMAFGAQFGYESTGGRLHYGDFSGESYVNQALDAFTFGFNTSEFIKKEQRYAIPIFVNIDAVFTKLEIESSLRLGNQEQSEQANFSSLGISFEPGVGYRRYFSWFVLGFDVGYEININDKLYFDEDNQAYLTGVDDNPLKAQWSGFRMKLGAGIRF